jgi:RNA polymerase sigma factor (sigma-70 family)
LETVLHALTRYEDFDPTATGGLSWWLFCWGLVIAQERTEMRTQGQVAPAHACTLEDFWSAPEENPQTLEDLTAGIEVNQGLTDALIRAAQLGSGRAIDLALERWQPRILKMIRSSIGRELHAAYMDEYDLRQDVNLQVLKSLDTSKLSGRGSFPNFLYSIVRRRVLTAYRARRVPTVTGDQLSEVLDAYDDTNWMDGLEQGLQELARMNPKYESVLRMRLEAISHRRIAEALGCTESMSKVLTARAKAKLGSIVARLRNEGASED